MIASGARPEGMNCCDSEAAMRSPERAARDGRL